MKNQIKTYYPVILKPISNKKVPQTCIYTKINNNFKLLDVIGYVFCSKDTSIVAISLYLLNQNNLSKVKICFEKPSSLSEIIEKNLTKYEILEFNNEQIKNFEAYFKILKKKNAQ